MQFLASYLKISLGDALSVRNFSDRLNIICIVAMHVSPYWVGCEEDVLLPIPPGLPLLLSLEIASQATQPLQLLKTLPQNM